MRVDAKSDLAALDLNALQLAFDDALDAAAGAVEDEMDAPEVGLGRGHLRPLPVVRILVREPIGDLWLTWVFDDCRNVPARDVRRWVVPAPLMRQTEKENNAACWQSG
jgi:hypothetical protein